jgi:uncharacterized protein (DUF302 family)
MMLAARARMLSSAMAVPGGREFMRAILLAILALFCAAPAMSQETVVTRASRYNFAETVTRLEASIRQTEFRVFGRLDHSAAARDVGLAMPPAVVVVFGNPRVGTPQFLLHPMLAIDFPLKALVWQDAQGRVSVTYNTAQYVFGLYARFGAGPVPDEAVRGLETELAQIVARAVE